MAVHQGECVPVDDVLTTRQRLGLDHDLVSRRWRTRRCSAPRGRPACAAGSCWPPPRAPRRTTRVSEVCPSATMPPLGGSERTVSECADAGPARSSRSTPRSQPTASARRPSRPPEHGLPLDRRGARPGHRPSPGSPWSRGGGRCASWPSGRSRCHPAGARHRACAAGADIRSVAPRGLVHEGRREVGLVQDPGRLVGIDHLVAELHQPVRGGDRDQVDVDAVAGGELRPS